MLQQTRKISICKALKLLRRISLVVTPMLQIKNAILSVEDAYLSYGSMRALAGLSLQLFAGELVGLLGPNGAGKTTLINCLSNRQKLDRGKICVDVAGPLADSLGIVPQEVAVYPDLTVEQNLLVFGRLQGLKGHLLCERIGEALEWASLGERRSSLARKLSGGMQRRLNIACSVLHRPQILLLDEPTVGVDPQSRERIYTMLDTLLEHGTAILLTTHQLDEAQSRCDRIAIIDAGKLLDMGTYEELLGRTIGTSQYVSIRFTTPPSALPPQLRMTDSNMEALGVIEDVLVELPELLFELKRCSASIEHLTLREPTLQHMFLHLTGKELRE